MFAVRLPTRSKSKREIQENFVAAKFAQVSRGISQFFERDSTHHLRTYVICKWAFAAMEENVDDGHAFFKIEVKDLNTGEIANRIWEMKADILIEDQEFCEDYDKLGFSSSTFVMSWQKLWGDRSDPNKNTSLKLAIQETLTKFRFKMKKYVVTNVFYKNRTLMDKLYIGLEYKIQGEFVDPEDKVHKFEWIVVGSKNLRSYQLVHTEHYELTGQQPKYNEMSSEEKTQIVLFAREELLKADKSGNPGDWIAECCHLVRLKQKKDGYIVFFYILQRFQNNTFGIIDIEVQKKDRFLYLLSFAKMGYSQESHNTLLSKGTMIDPLQYFHARSCVTTNEVVKNCIESARVHIKTVPDLVIVDRMSCRIIREKGKIRCLEYRLQVRLNDDDNNPPKEEWIVERDIENSEYHFIFSMKFLNQTNIRVLDSSSSKRSPSRVSRSVESRETSLIRSFIVKGRQSAKERDLSYNSSFSDLKNRTSVDNLSKFRSSVDSFRKTAEPGSRKPLFSSKVLTGSQKALFEITKSQCF